MRVYHGYLDNRGVYRLFDFRVLIFKRKLNFSGIAAISETCSSYSIRHIIICTVRHVTEICIICSRVQNKSNVITRSEFPTETVQRFCIRLGFFFFSVVYLFRNDYRNQRAVVRKSFL